MCVNTCETSWYMPPKSLRLEDNEVHVWHTTLNIPTSYTQALAHTLTNDERKRADMFRFPQDRHRFIVAHGLLRTILAQYLGQAASALRFCNTEYGKPVLDLDDLSYNESTLLFNMTHTHNDVLYAVSRNKEVGIDIEYIDASLAFEPIAQQFFSRYERDTLFSIPVHLRREAFFRCWTRKEAYVKARGVGLSLPLDQFDVSVMPGDKAALLQSREAGQDVSHWLFHDLTPSTDCVATLAVAGQPCLLTCWQMPVARGHIDT